MGRLIDADALIEAMRKTEEEFENAMTCPSWWSAYRVIKEQPTAYDVEAVVAELEVEKERHEKDRTYWSEHSWKDSLMYNECDMSDRKADCFDKAISIVRGKE